MKKYKKITLFIVITTMALHFFFLPNLNQQETISSWQPTKRPAPTRKISSRTPPPAPQTATSAAPVSPLKESSAPYQGIRRELSRFHHQDTRITIEKRAVLSADKHKVLVTYTLPNGQRNSFLAIVDLKTQALTRRWGRTIHEKLGPPPLKFFPTGRI